MTEVMSENRKYKKYYNKIFSYFYLVQGLNDGIQGIVLPVYLISLVEDIDLAFILLVLSITAIPWSFKFFIGLMNDKYGSEKYGRRRPWIITLGIWAGIWWIILGSAIPSGMEAIFFALLCVFMINLGLAVADTSLDGLILDVTPSDKLGKIQGATWSMYLVGSMSGGILLGVLFSIYNIIPFLFILEGIFMISCVILPYLIKESPPKEVQVWKGLKEIVVKGKNWKIFISTFLESIPKNIVPLLLGLLIISSLPNSPIETKNISISLVSSSFELIFLFGIFSAIAGVGVIFGCGLGGKISDKNRRLSVYIGHVILIPLLLFCVLAQINLVIAIIIMIILGLGQGMVRTSYQVVRSDLAQKYPKLTSTYYAIIISFLNLGITAGYLISSILLNLFSSVFNISEYYLTFFLIMIVMTCIQTASLVIFMTIDRDEYEIKDKVIEVLPSLPVTP